MFCHGLTYFIFVDNPLATLTMTDFVETRLADIFPHKKSQRALIALYNQLLITTPVASQPRKIVVYSSCRLRAGLFARSTPCFRKEPRYDYVSLTQSTFNTPNEITELGCLCAIYHPHVIQPTNVAVVLHYDDVRSLQNVVVAKTNSTNVSQITVGNSLNVKYASVFDRIQRVHRPLEGAPYFDPLTDGRLRLGRRYVTERPRDLGSQHMAFSIIPINRIFKPEHILRDLKLHDNKKVEVQAYYVQNTRTYYSNLSLSL